MFYYLFQALNNYANFKGRTSRQAYWRFASWLSLIFIVHSIWTSCLGLLSHTMAMMGSSLGLALLLLFVIPTISIAVRRFHDVGRGISGYWLFAALILLVLSLCFTTNAIPVFFPMKNFSILFRFFFLFFILAWLLTLIISCRNGSPQTNCFGPPADDIKPNDYKFVYTSTLKKCLVAWIILSVCLFVLSFVLKAFEEKHQSDAKNSILETQANSGYTHTLTK